MGLSTQWWTWSKARSCHSQTEKTTLQLYDLERTHSRCFLRARPLEGRLGWNSGGRGWGARHIPAECHLHLSLRHCPCQPVQTGRVSCPSRGHGASRELVWSWAGREAGRVWEELGDRKEYDQNTLWKKINEKVQGVKTLNFKKKSKGFSGGKIRILPVLTDLNRMTFLMGCVTLEGSRALDWVRKLLSLSKEHSSVWMSLITQKYLE